MSASGHCRPFDVRADGTIFGSGVGVVVLKPLQAAVDDGDRIHAVIRGSAINNDGSTKMNYAAPNAAGQAEVIAEAHAVADVDASTVSYVETHGTGTPLGDPIEIEGLRQAFDVSTATRPGPCVLGSVKSNIGHLEVASGIASLIKTILCLKHRAIPGTLHFTSPNPELHLDRGPFVVRSEYGPWEWDGVRRAGVSSFGVGGTNAHVVLEEAPAVSAPVIHPGPQVLLLSARTAEALRGVTLGPGRRVVRPRRAEPVRCRLHPCGPPEGEHPDGGGRQRPAARGSGARARPSTTMSSSASPSRATNRIRSESFSSFRARVLSTSEWRAASTSPSRCSPSTSIECAAGFDEELGIDLRAEVFDGTGRNLERTDRAQPALFAVEYALAKLIESYGVRAAALAGHSIGEYVAATVAGVFDLPTAVKAVSMRARLMHASPRGVMVAVALSPDAIAEYLSPDVDLAAVNDPGSCVVAGSEESIRTFQERLAERGIVARRVRTSHAFHSRLMDPVIPEFTGFLSRLTLREPQIPMLSNVTGTWMSAGEATNPATWARQIRATVRFSDELDVLLADPCRVLVEVGPGGTLTAIGDASPEVVERAPCRSAHAPPGPEPRTTTTPSCSRSGSSGQRVSMSTGQPLSAGHRPRQVSLPGYPFVRQRHWVDHNATVRWAGDAAAATNGTAVAPSAGPIRSAAATNGKSPMEATLQRIWAQCLGVGSVDRNANFFELGGDSLIAISVAMTAANEGLDLTPQDLYENQTVAALAKALVARYAAGGLARQSPGDVEHPPVPPNIAHFLEHGLRERRPVAHSPDPATSPRCAGRGRSVGAHRRDQSSRCAAAADCAARGNVGAAHRRTAGVHRTGHRVASRRARAGKPAGAGSGVRHPERADPRPGPVEPTADRHLYQWRAGRSVLSRDQCARDRGRQRVARHPAHRHLHRIRPTAGGRRHCAATGHHIVA